MCYVYVVVFISDDPGKYMSRIQEDFNLKDGKIVDPDMYLGADIFKMLLKSGKM